MPLTVHRGDADQRGAESETGAAIYRKSPPIEYGKSDVTLQDNETCPLRQPL